MVSFLWTGIQYVTSYFAVVICHTIFLNWYLLKKLRVTFWFCIFLMLVCVNELTCVLYCQNVATVQPHQWSSTESVDSYVNRYYLNLIVDFGLLASLTNN